MAVSREAGKRSRNDAKSAEGQMESWPAPCAQGDNLYATSTLRCFPAFPSRHLQFSFLLVLGRHPRRHVRRCLSIAAELLLVGAPAMSNGMQGSRVLVHFRLRYDRPDPSEARPR